MREEARGEPGWEGETPRYRREEAGLIRFSSSVNLTVDGCLSTEHKYSSVRSIKAIRFRYSSSNALTSLFEDFRLMCNDAIRIALKEKPRSRFKLIEMAYPRLKEYGLHTHYILSACEVAYSVYRNRNRRSDPYVEKAFLKLDNLTYTLNHLLLRIPTPLGASSTSRFKARTITSPSSTTQPSREVP